MIDNDLSAEVGTPTLKTGFFVNGVVPLVLGLLMIVLTTFGARAQDADFTGDWQTYWRTGSAVLSLVQEGDTVSGTYQPDDGRVEGTVEGRVLRGTWEQTGSSGRFVFALSEDGDVLTGRFGNGEYWNGLREDVASGSSAWQLDNGTPRETLRSLLLVANSAIYDGDAGALRRASGLLSYAGSSAAAGQEARRRTLMFEILDLSTLRILDAPLEANGADGIGASFDIGPAGVPVKTTLEFAQHVSGGWRLVLPTEAVLAEERDRLLAAMGYDSKAELDRDRANSPRAVLREFIQGTTGWNDGGRDRALAVLDLSMVPERLHDLEGPIYADFLRRILDRIAYVIWQEIPDDPDRTVPYVYFQHPVGTISIAKVTTPEADGGAAVGQWKISAETLATAPALLQAMQDLPVIGGLENPRALSPFFRLREAIRALHPGLLDEWGYLALWQWLGFLGAILASGLAFWLTTRVMGILSRLSSKTAWLARLAAPTGLLGAGLIVNWMVWRLGITQAGIPMIGSLASVFLVVTIAFFVYRLATVAGGWAHATARKTTSYVDEIATSLGTGLVKLLIVVGAIIAIADVAGLPYEGVLTGLGVGGVAIAFAARDTVSNIMGGGLLMADRPFSRGDLIEIDGKLATVEEVGLRSTRLRALDDTLLHVPNVQLSDRIIANWGRRRRRKLSMLIGVTYDTPRETLDEFAKRLRDVLLSQPEVDRDDVYVGLKGFGASSIDIDLLCHLRVSDYSSQVEAQHKIMMDIIALAEDLSVEFAFPTRTLHLADPTQVSAERFGNAMKRADPGPLTSPTPAKTQG